MKKYPEEISAQNLGNDGRIRITQQDPLEGIIWSFRKQTTAQNYE